MTPRLTLTYKLNEDSNLYLNFANGTKPGDFNSQVPQALDANGVAYDQLTWSLRSPWGDGMGLLDDR